MSVISRGHYSGAGSVIIAAMRKWLRIALVLGFILAIGLSFGYWWGTPRLLEVNPSDKNKSVPINTELRMVFSHPMQHEMVFDRLSIEPSVPGDFSWEGNILIFEPSKSWESGAMVQISLDPGARRTGLLPLPMSEGLRWTFMVREPRLAYLYPSEGPANIYLLDPSSGDQYQLTFHSGGVQDFSIGAFGAAIFYSARNEQGGSQIFHLNLSDSGDANAQKDASEVESQPQSVIACPQASCRAVAISPDGRFLAYERAAFKGSGEPETPRVWLADLKVQDNQISPVLAGNPDHQTIQPEWSSENWLAFYDQNALAYILYDPVITQPVPGPSQPISIRPQRHE